MGAATLKWDHAAFGRQVLNASWIQAAMLARAERGAGAARAVAAQHIRTGELEKSIQTRSGTHGGIHGDRAYAEVFSSDPNVLAIEFGHVQALGSRFDDEGRRVRISGPGRYVEGIHAFGHAAAAMQ